VWPSIEEICCIDGSKPRCQVVSRSSRVCRVVLGIRRRELADNRAARRTEAVVELSGVGILPAGNIHVAAGDVVEDARFRGKVAIELARIASGDAALIKLLGSERVVNIVGVALPAKLLVDQGLNTSHGRRAK
jgi:hypothetical protein